MKDSCGWLYKMCLVISNIVTVRNEIKISTFFNGTLDLTSFLVKHMAASIFAVIAFSKFCFFLFVEDYPVTFAI